MRLAALMAAASLAAGCRSATASDSVAETEWLANRDKWRAAGVTSYEMQMRSECFCGAPTESVRLVVRNGAVQSRVVVETGVPVDAAFAKWFPEVLGSSAWCGMPSTGRRRTSGRNTMRPTGIPTSSRSTSAAAALATR